MSSSFPLTASPPVVRVEQGALVGDNHGVDGCYRFLGIPYAAPPVGQLRWHPPMPPASWQGERLATEFGPSAIQIKPDAALPPDLVTSEDCLYLNVWTRSLAPSAKQPVMVWIHGGGFLYGSPSMPLYHGGPLAQHGVTLVSVSYRLGVFGFLRHPDVGGNFAVLDWVAALTWVSRNIRAFGGDPNNVTIFGESAGAVAVRALLSTPAAKGLFHRAITQSAGFEPSAALPKRSIEGVVRVSEHVFEALGTRELDALRSIPADVVRKVSLAAGREPEPGVLPNPNNLKWVPVFDGTVMTNEFSGWADGVPILFGVTADEMRCFFRPKGVLDRPDLSPAVAYTAQTFEEIAHLLAGHAARDLVSFYASQQLTPYEAIVELATTAIWSEPALAMYNRLAALPGRTAYFYRFSRVSPATRRAGLLALHTSELPYIFGPMTRRTLWKPWGERPPVLEEGTELPEDRDFDAVDVQLSRAMQEAWVEFARTGVARSNGREWPRCTLSDPHYTALGDCIERKPLDFKFAETAIQKLRR